MIATERNMTIDECMQGLRDIQHGREALDQFGLSVSVIAGLLNEAEEAKKTIKEAEKRRAIIEADIILREKRVQDLKNTEANLEKEMRPKRESHTHEMKKMDEEEARRQLDLNTIEAKVRNAEEAHAALRGKVKSLHDSLA